MSDDLDRARLIEGLARAVRRPWRLNEARRLSLDSLSQRYAAARGLTHQPDGRTPPGTWFLETVDPDKSHSFLLGALGGGLGGELFYAERAIPVKHGQLMEGWTVALYRLPVATELAYGIACLFRPGAAWGGALRVPVDVPDDLVEVSVHDATLEDRFLVAVTEDDRSAVARLFTDDFIAWIDGLPWHRAGDEVTRFELRHGVLCVYAKPKVRTVDALDLFCEHAARIAAHVVEVAGAA